MSYGVRYICEFDSIAEESYTVELLQKDYAGESALVIAGSKPVMHSVDSDDPRAPIRGSGLTINLINEDGSLPLTNFYSNDDEEWKVKFYWNSQVLFEGFIVQDDCQELIVDYTHEISLSATDNLGLLKDEPLIFGIERVYLIDVVRQCLVVTGLELDVNYYTNLQESTVLDYNTPFLEQVVIDTRTFLKNDTEFESCYDALTKILERFNLTLFQAYGEWQIIRWDEASYYLNAIEGFNNMYGFEEIFTPIVLNQVFTTGFGLSTFPEAGLVSRIKRPIRYAKEQFDYVQPAQILENANLQELGSLITSYADGPNTVYEYEMPKWFDSPLSGLVADYFIRVIYDSANNEIDRYVVASNDGIVGTAIPAHANDKFKYSFQFRTNQNFPGPVVIQFQMRLFDGVDTYFAKSDGTWSNISGFAYSYPDDIDGNQFYSATLEPGKIPVDGLLYLHLPLIAANPTPVNYKDVRLEYSAYVNDSSKIIGHIHQTSQDYNIKKVSDRKIFLDDAPRKYMKGALFLNINEANGLKLTSQWRNKSNAYLANEKVGAIITYEQLFQNNKPRTILEGTFRGLVQDTKHISPLSIILYAQKSGLNFIYGRMDIDYRNDSVTGTLYELWEGFSPFIPNNYEFNYIYDTK